MCQNWRTLHPLYVQIRDMCVHMTGFWVPILDISHKPGQVAKCNISFKIISIKKNKAETLC